MHILMSAVRLSLPGSPRAWQWQVDEEAERNCITTLIWDAVYGSIYESGLTIVSYLSSEWLAGLNKRRRTATPAASRYAGTAANDWYGNEGAIFPGVSGMRLLR